MNYYSKYLSYLFFFFIITTPIIAQEAIVTDRPDQTESALVVPKNAFQIETGAAIDNLDGLNTFVLNNALFRYGIHEKVELRMVQNVLARTVSDDLKFGLADMELGFKYEIINSSVRLAILSHAIIPNGSSEFTNENLGLNSRLCFSHGVTDRFSLGYNIGYSYASETEQEAFYTVSAGFGLTDKLGFFAEFYGSGDVESELNHLFDLGFTLLQKENLQFDLSYGFDLDEYYDFVAFGVSWLLL